ncbi:helicase associated domain-containing protein [Streptomyces sp. NPDC048720]|uniref:helicase associated domain-containing protein n=1 Tax=Streptomyces sp. NPDC048720 TaxID=3365588 RepID=UPI003723BC49
MEVGGTTHRATSCARARPPSAGTTSPAPRHTLGIHPATDDEKPKARRSQADDWTLNLTGARQFRERTGHLRVPRKHIERIVVNGGDQAPCSRETCGREAGGEGAEEHHLRRGAWVNNQRSRAAALTPERVEQFAAIGMR